MLYREPDIVEDSEPEREALRLAHNSSMGSDSVIELTEKEESARHVSLAAPDYVSSSADVPFREKPASLLSPCDAYDSSSGEEKIIDLRGFAYLGAQPPAKPISMALPGAASLDQESKGKRKKRGRADLFPDGLSESHLTKLTKCVSCDTPWTTRKGAVQKMKHIRSCARKKGINSETIRITVLKEVEYTTINKAVKKEQTTSQSTEVTLLENTVNTLTTRKKSRLRVQETVKGVAVTRDTILDRAKEVLACGAQSALGGGKMDIQDGGLLIPSTQQFGQSALKQRCPSKVRFFAEASMDKSEHHADRATPSHDYSNALINELGDENAIKSRNEIGVSSDPHETTIPPNNSRGNHKASATTKVVGHITSMSGLELEDVSNKINVESPEVNEGWMHQLRSVILQDRDLHLRILHYEPVHFDVFKTLSKTSGLTAPEMETTLQTFLDKEAGCNIQ
ncbi:hypothetical protein AX15_006361 [Amanita polypyramis BW_CC]|nr:hypothetical protein AX15_006361 [Amanita polypyramis BW_CC]